MAAAAILDFQNVAFLMKYFNFYYVGVCAVILQTYSSIRSDVISIFCKSKMAAAAILDFWIFPFLMKYFNFYYVKVCAVKISAK